MSPGNRFAWADGPCAEAQSAIRDADERNLPTVSSKELLVVAFAIASFNCRVYDSL